MQKLKKVLLINWFYYEKLIVDFDDINYISGKNSAGKSTFIDALMIVLLGEVSSRNFNKAANEGAKRTLDGYLLADSDPNNPKSRKGRFFNTYIACEFFDDYTGSSYTLGIIFECNPGSSERYNFFMFDGCIPENCFVIGRQPMDIAQLRAYLKETYKSRQEIYDNNKKYKAVIKAKWNVHTEQIFSLLKKGVSFKPIVDIKQFITENVCDIQDRPDIAAMQQNIQDYKHQETLAIRQEERQTHLQAIHELDVKRLRAFELLNLHEYLKARAEKEIEESYVFKFKIELKDKNEELLHLDSEYEKLKKESEGLNLRHDQLLRDKANSEISQKVDRLEQEKKVLSAEKAELDKQLKNTADMVRREAFVWLSYCKKLEAAPWAQEPMYEPLLSDAVKLKKEFLKIEQCSADDLGKINLSVFEFVQKSSRLHADLLRKTCYETKQALADKKAQHESHFAALKKLEKGIKNYPHELLRFKTALDQGLSSQTGAIPTYILADLMEISDPVWQGAVEGYLNTQRFLLIVPPQHYDAALRVYNQIKREFHGYGLVDIEKVRRNQHIQRMPNSLATKVTVTNALVKEYMDFLLGRVICCGHISELRKHSVAITAEGMLYQGYVSRAIPRNIMEYTYIGKQAIKRQIKETKDALSRLEQQIDALSAARDMLLPYESREILFTEYFMSETIAAMPEKYARIQDISKELDKITYEIGNLDLTWLFNIDKQIGEIKSSIAENQKKREENSSGQALCEDRIHKIQNEILPEHNENLRGKEAWISERFSEAYIASTGDARYQEELSRLKSSKSILKNFGDQLVQTKKRYDYSWQELVYKRREYVNSFPPCSYRPDDMDNNEFDAELKNLNDVELPQYKEKIKKARESALEQFQNDFLAKIKANIDAVQTQVRDLNKALKKRQFGSEEYEFKVTKNPDYIEYYNMIMDPDLMENNEGLFSLAFQNRYGALIDELFSRIIASDDIELNARKQSELQQNIEKFTDYRTYLHFDLETTDQNGKVELLSQTLNTKSGGETQTPFYIAMLASFANMYRVHDNTSYGNTMRLVVFDEAFNKMDSERIVECVRLLRKMGLQAIFSTPPDKLPNIMPEADNTLLAYRQKYHMQLLPWSQKMEDTILEL